MTDAAAACRVTMDYIKHAPGPAYGTVMCRGAGGCGTGGSSLYKQAALLSMHFKSLFPLNCRIANFGIIWRLQTEAFSLSGLWRKIACGGLWRVWVLRRRKPSECVFIRRECSIRMDGIPGVVPRWWRSQAATCTGTIRQNSAPLPGLPGPALRTNLFLLPTNVSTNMMTEEERGEEILHYCCGDASIITGT